MREGTVLRVIPAKVVQKRLGVKNTKDFKVYSPTSFTYWLYREKRERSLTLGELALLLQTDEDTTAGLISGRFVPDLEEEKDLRGKVNAVAKSLPTRTSNSAIH